MELARLEAERDRARELGITVEFEDVPRTPQEVDEMRQLIQALMKIRNARVFLFDSQPNAGVVSEPDVLQQPLEEAV